MEYIEINNQEYSAEISGMMEDYAWDRRESKTIHIPHMSYEAASELFVDGASWSIISEWDETVVDPETGEEKVVPKREEYDNSDFNLAGEITDHRDGSVSVKMGKMTDLESVLEAFLGGE